MSPARQAAPQPRICIVYSRVGGGHLSAARAIKAALDDVPPAGAVHTCLVDAYLECSRWPVSRFPDVYARVARHHPALWAAFFRATDRRLPVVDVDATLLLEPFMRAGLQRLLADQRPDVVVSVLPGVNGALARAAAAAASRPRLEVVLTDWYAVHRTWLARGVQRYTVATEPARLDCVRYGADPATVEVVGLPVRAAFVDPPPRPRARAALAASIGLDPTRFTVLVMVGAEGSPRSLTNVRVVLGLDLDAQVVVLCGRDDELRRQVEGMARRPDTRVLGFHDDVVTLMRAGDLLVTKAGGISLAEAFCCGVPTVVADVLAGQESGNLTYALQRGAVAYAPHPRALGELVAALRHDDERRRMLGQRGAALARPDAARVIAAGLLARYCQGSALTGSTI